MSELDAYHELCAYTLARGDAEFVHQLVVDSYCAQNATLATKRMAITFALLGLCLHVERNYTGRQVQRAHMHFAREKREWPLFSLPQNRGATRASDVLQHTEGAKRDAAISKWAKEVWLCFANDPQTAETIRRLCDEVGFIASRRKAAATLP
jgi:hypothetical protein